MVITARTVLAAARRLHVAKMMLHFVRKYSGKMKFNKMLWESTVRIEFSNCLYRYDAHMKYSRQSPTFHIFNIKTWIIISLLYMSYSSSCKI